MLYYSNMNFPHISLVFPAHCLAPSLSFSLPLLSHSLNCNSIAYLQSFLSLSLSFPSLPNSLCLHRQYAYATLARLVTLIGQPFASHCAALRWLRLLTSCGLWMPKSNPLFWVASPCHWLDWLGRLTGRAGRQTVWTFSRLFANALGASVWWRLIQLTQTQTQIVVRNLSTHNTTHSNPPCHTASGQLAIDESKSTSRVELRI